MALVVAAVGLFAYPFATDIYQRILQSRLRSQLDNPNYATLYRLHEIKVGQGLTRIVIPKINLDVLVVQGTTPAALEAGAGHYVNTPLPGEAGNVAIAGHRTTFGHPFNRLDEMHPGDDVELFSPYDEYVYQAVPSFDGKANPHPVLPTDTSVLAPPPNPKDHWLTLTTCNPKGSAAQRLILRLTLVRTIPLPAPAK
ncbi:MAG: class E sortase [Mycobacteriales bacterium]